MPDTDKELLVLAAPDDWDDDIELSGQECPHCQAGNTYTRTCFNCGGEGSRELYEEDPFWYSPGDTSDCDVCSGHGTQHWCRACGYDFHAKRVICAAAALGAEGEGKVGG